jgi:hypothetical protein
MDSSLGTYMEAFLDPQTGKEESTTVGGGRGKIRVTQKLNKKS